MVWEVVLVPEGRGSLRSARPSCRCRRCLPLTRRLCVLLPGAHSPLHLGAWPGKKGSSAHPRAKGLQYREGQ